MTEKLTTTNINMVNMTENIKNITTKKNINGWTWPKIENIKNITTKTNINASFVSRVGLVSKFVDQGDVELIGFDNQFSVKFIHFLVKFKGLSLLLWSFGQVPTLRFIIVNFFGQILTNFRSSWFGQVN